MLSILIPIYNYNSNSLIKELWTQAQNIGTDFEIICIEDGSTLKFLDQDITNLNKVKYEAISTNIGRSRIRNLLARKAMFSNLLFLDCDSIITSSNYIKNYLTCISLSYDVIYGGTEYSQNRPNDYYQLHWSYATKYEALPCKLRNEDPYLSFKTNNFLIRKEIFNTVSFDEKINGYGYEDSLFAMELMKHTYQIKHIDNPVLHGDLSTNEELISKIKESLINLKKINETQNKLETKLVRVYHQLENLGLLKIMGPISGWACEKIKIMVIHYPSQPKFLQLYKLMYYIKIKRPA